MTLRRLSGTIPFTGAYTSPGAMCHWISIYQRAPRNADGTYPDDQLFISSWAAMRTLQGRELDKAREISQEVEVLFSVLYIPGLNESMTIKRYTGELYQIMYISDPDGRKVEQRIFARLVNQTER